MSDDPADEAPAVTAEPRRSDSTVDDLLEAYPFDEDPPTEDPPTEDQFAETDVDSDALDDDVFAEMDVDSDALDDDVFAEMDVDSDALDDDVFAEMDVDSDALDDDVLAAVDDEDATLAPGDASGVEPAAEGVVVPKRSYCEGCPHFSAPPEVACTNPGTTIHELVDTEHFRVSNCPVVADRSAVQSVGEE